MWNYLLRSLLIHLLFYLVRECVSEYLQFTDDVNHPCLRPCPSDPKPRVCEYNFTVEWYYVLSHACFDCPFNISDCARPHCVTADGTRRAVLTVNRKLPGPAIQVCEGDTIVVNVDNQMQGGEGLAIHWHGIHQRGTPFMDGVPMVTQCPIPSHSTFQYKFKASHPGTFFWHAHGGMQRSNGIFGALVIRQSSKQEPHINVYDHDLPEHVIMINDWMKDVMISKFTAHHHSFGSERPDSILINGKGFLNPVVKPDMSTMMGHHGHGVMVMGSADDMDHGAIGHHQMVFEDNSKHHIHSQMMHHLNMNNSINSSQRIDHRAMGHGTDGGSAISSQTQPRMMQHMKKIQGMARSGEGNGSRDGMTEAERVGEILTTQLTRSKRHAGESHASTHSPRNLSESEHNTMMKEGDTSQPTHPGDHGFLSDEFLQNENQYTPVAVFEVAKGKRFRFRIASSGILTCPIEISIDNHTLLVIATDGVPVHPVDVDSFIINSGERLDFILHANQETGNFWIRAKGKADCKGNKVSQTAILRYKGARNESPLGSIEYGDMGRKGKVLKNGKNSKSGITALPIAQLDSLAPEDVTSTRPPDVKHYLEMDFKRIDNYHYQHPELYPINQIKNAHHLFTTQINNISYINPSSPMLTQYNDVPQDKYCNANTTQDCDMEFCECVHKLDVTLGHVVELVLINNGFTMNSMHPMHLHGQYFRVVALEKIGSSLSTAQVKQMDEDGKITRKLHRPILKDTITVPDGGFAIIRFHATNPGMWLLHCHVEFHIDTGMLLVLQVGDPDQFPKAPVNFPKCGNWKMPEELPKLAQTSSTTSDSITKKMNIVIILISCLLLYM